MKTVLCQDLILFIVKREQTFFYPESSSKIEEFPRNSIG